MDLSRRKVEITSQNHNFSVQMPNRIHSESKESRGIQTPYGPAAISHVSLNDHSVEGMRLVEQPVLSVQYHPEASPGPHDPAYLFQEFSLLMESRHA
jgi:carbamoyl-phosphate synthase small subunit